MPDMDKLISAIDAAEELAYGSDTHGGDSQLSVDRAYSIRLYMGENIEPAPDGRSQVTDRSVFETIQWILPSLSRVFAGGGDLVSIPPIGPDDEEGAKQEAEYINWVMTQQNPWFETFLIWAMDALMTRNSYCMAYMDRQRIYDVERYERQTQEGVAMLLEDVDVEVIGAKEYPDDQAQPEPVPGPDGQPMVGPDGQPVMAPPQMLYDIEIRRGGEKRKVCLKVLPPERCKVSHHTSSYRLNDCDYFEYWEIKTLSQLRAEGFDVADDVAADYNEDTTEDIARDLYNENRRERTFDPAMRRVKARMIWIKHDYDEDGIAELHKCLRVGREILMREETTSIPVASMIPSPLPHRHPGISITDMVEDIQRIKTTILRQGLDNLYLSNNPQKVINSHQVNLDDVLTSVPGGIIRTNDVNAIRYEIVPFVFPQAMEGLEYMDQVKENRTGTNRYFTGIDQNALNKTASGIQQLSTMAAQRVEQVARIMGSCVEDLARIVHEIILKSGHKQETVKIRGQWVEVDPATWRKRYDFRIAVGFAAGNKDAMVARLQMIAASQLQAVELGLPIVQPQNMYETMLELTKASDFSSPERFWTDPATQEPQQAPPDPNMLKLQADSNAKLAELESDQQKSGAEMQMKEREIETNAALTKYKIDKEAETKIILAQMQGEISTQLETHKSGLVVDKEQSKRMAETDKVVQGTQGIVEQQTAQIAQMLQSVLDVVNSNLLAIQAAPKRIKRDKAGRPEAVETVLPDGSVVSKDVMRDKYGTITGTA